MIRNSDTGDVQFIRDLTICFAKHDQFQNLAFTPAQQSARISTCKISCSTVTGVSNYPSCANN